MAANLNNLAWLYDQKGDTEKALSHARRAYELSPKRPEIADTLGWLLIRQGDTAAAMPLLEQALEGSPRQSRDRLSLCLGALQGWQDGASHRDHQ